MSEKGLIPKEESLVSQSMNQKMYLHKSCLPIDQAEFKTDKILSLSQLDLPAQDCEGMCGV
jgi:hypothetical protein